LPGTRGGAGHGPRTKHPLLLVLGWNAQRERRRPKGCLDPYPGDRGGVGRRRQGIGLRGGHGRTEGNGAQGKEKARHAQEATAIVISGLDS